MTARKRAVPIDASRLPEWVQPHVPAGLDGVDLMDWYLTLDQGRRIGLAEMAEKSDDEETIGALSVQLDRFFMALAERFDGQDTMLSTLSEAASVVMAQTRPSDLAQEVARRANGAKRLRTPAPINPPPPVADPFDPDKPIEEFIADEEGYTDDGPASPASPADDAHTQIIEKITTDDDPAMRVGMPPDDIRAVLDYAVEAVEKFHPGDQEAFEKARRAVVRQMQGWTANKEAPKQVPWKSVPSRGFHGVVLANLGRLGIIPAAPKEHDPEVD